MWNLKKSNSKKQRIRWGLQGLGAGSWDQRMSRMKKCQPNGKKFLLTKMSESQGAIVQYSMES
jgi:hypothetical protein